MAFRESEKKERSLLLLAASTKMGKKCYVSMNEKRTGVGFPKIFRNSFVVTRKFYTRKEKNTAFPHTYSTYRPLSKPTTINMSTERNSW